MFGGGGLLRSGRSSHDKHGCKNARRNRVKINTSFLSRELKIYTQKHGMNTEGNAQSATSVTFFQHHPEDATELPDLTALLSGINNGKRKRGISVSTPQEHATVPRICDGDSCYLIEQNTVTACLSSSSSSNQSMIRTGLCTDNN